MKQKVAHIALERPRGFTERADCAVLALAAVLCIEYSDALALLAAAGRKPRCGTYNRDVQRAARLAGYELLATPAPRIGPAPPAGYFDSRPHVTVARLLDHLPARGHFYVTTSTHAFAVIDGKLYDNGAARPRGRVVSVLRLEGF